MDEIREKVKHLTPLEYPNSRKLAMVGLSISFEYKTCKILVSVLITKHP